MADCLSVCSPLSAATAATSLTGARLCIRRLTAASAASSQQLVHRVAAFVAGAVAARTALRTMEQELGRTRAPEAQHRAGIAVGFAGIFGGELLELRFVGRVGDLAVRAELAHQALRQ